MKELNDRVKHVEEQVKEIAVENEKLLENMEQIVEKRTFWTNEKYFKV